MCEIFDGLQNYERDYTSLVLICSSLLFTGEKLITHVYDNPYYAVVRLALYSMSAKYYILTYEPYSLNIIISVRDGYLFARLIEIQRENVKINEQNVALDVVTLLKSCKRLSKDLFVLYNNLRRYDETHVKIIKDRREFVIIPLLFTISK